MHNKDLIHDMKSQFFKNKKAIFYKFLINKHKNNPKK